MKKTIQKPGANARRNQYWKTNISKNQGVCGKGFTKIKRNGIVHFIILRFAAEQ